LQRAGSHSSAGSGFAGVGPRQNLSQTASDGLEADAAAAAAAVEEMSAGRSEEMDGWRDPGRSPTKRESPEPSPSEGGAWRPARRDVAAWSSMRRLWPPPRQSLAGVTWLAQDGVAAAEEDVVRAVHSVYMAAAMRAGGALEQQARRAYEALEESSTSSVAFTRCI
jgi:hypothetical protein